MKSIVVRYVNSAKALVECRQKHFRQVCGRCKEFPGCPVYGEHFAAWIQLQQAALEGP
jgi:hypothetical protein